jgi:hypothetical protein
MTLALNSQSNWQECCSIGMATHPGILGNSLMIETSDNQISSLFVSMTYAR